MDSIKKNVQRIDAISKVLGKAKYTDDFFENRMLHAKILRSTISHGRVTHIDTKLAKEMEGVVAVYTFHDVPEHKYATAGHPWSLDESHRDVADRNILTGHIRYYGDEIAAIVAENELIAEKALKLIEVTYEEYEPIMTSEASLREGAREIHKGTKNIIADTEYTLGDIEEAYTESDFVFEDSFKTSVVQHCHLENQVSYAYIDDNNKITVVSSTQIPHICRRVVAQALGINWGMVRVIKPYIGGGFGNKQDVVQEPLNAFLTMKLNGRPVKINYTREESIGFTRTRHSMEIKSKTSVKKDGTIIAREMDIISINGGYASHGHSVTGNTGNKFKQLYKQKAIKWHARTIYTNMAAAGAMRGYGVPQVVYPMECQIEDIAYNLNLDPIEFRLKNFIDTSFVDPFTGARAYTCALPECLNRGKELIKWDEKREKYKNQTGNIRRGVGVAAFPYATNTYPYGVEMSGARIVMNQDGSIQLEMGATEIGQGADTVFAQIVSEESGIPMDMIYVKSSQDTDSAPFDTGSYASRQTYVSGAAAHKAASELKNKILEWANFLKGIPVCAMTVKDGNVVFSHNYEVIMSLYDLAMESFYHPDHAAPIRVEVTNQLRVNALAFGCTFVEVEVDLAYGKVSVIELYSILDSGKIVNHKLAEGQVQGGVSMALGYALSEQLLYDEKTGRVLNNNLLDYKLPTTMDAPNIGAEFVEPYEPTSPFGAKSLGENPVVSTAPAVRNAVLHATGVKFNEIPMTPQKLVLKFKEAGLI